MYSGIVSAFNTRRLSASISTDITTSNSVCFMLIAIVPTSF